MCNVDRLGLVGWVWSLRMIMDNVSVCGVTKGARRRGLLAWLCPRKKCKVYQSVSGVPGLIIQLAPWWSPLASILCRPCQPRHLHWPRLAFLLPRPWGFRLILFVLSASLELAVILTTPSINWIDRWRRAGLIFTVSRPTSVLKCKEKFDIKQF